MSQFIAKILSCIKPAEAKADEKKDAAADAAADATADATKEVTDEVTSAAKEVEATAADDAPKADAAPTPAEPAETPAQ